MASIPISYTFDIGERISGDHLISIAGIYYITCLSNNSADKASASSTFRVTSLNVIKSSVIDSLLLRVDESLSEGASGGSTFTLIFDDSSYIVGEDRYLSSEAISHLNRYKTNHGKFPDITLRVDSWVSRPPYNNDGTIQSYSYSFDLSGVFVTFTIQGDSLTLRPIADVSVEHEIPEGFSGVYQLINEELADDGETYIRSYVQASDKEKNQNRTSVVSLGSCNITEKKIFALRLVLRSRLNTTSSYGKSYVDYSIIVGEESLSGRFSEETNGYENLERNIFASESFIQSLNSIIKANGSLTEIKLRLNTYSYEKESGSYKSYSATASISQAYLEVYYEDILNIGIHRKVGGVVKAATAAYKKFGGSWVEVTEEEAKGVLKNNIITQGGS